jgi:hypothetical protein
VQALPLSKAKSMPSSAELSDIADHQLLLKVAGGCGDALTVLFDRYQRIVIKIALLVVHDRVRLRECCRDVSEKDLWHKLSCVAALHIGR